MHDRMMREALELASRGWGQVAPNPQVGAVVVREGRVVGRGHHARFGGPHAEIEALAEAGSLAHGSTLFVNLEPCAHTGKTPPCTDAIVEARVSRVVIGCRDPDAAAAGGANALRDAGVDVVFDVERIDAIRLNAGFLWNHEQERPWVELKLAISADDRIAAAPGERTQITGPEATAEVHRVRAGFDAIMVGSETALVDDPLLTVRGVVHARRPPVRIVLDGRLRLPDGSRLVRSVGEAPVWVVTGRSSSPQRLQELENAGVRGLRVDDADGRPAAESIVDALWNEGVRSLLIEGGAVTAGNFLSAGLVHRILLFQSRLELGPEGVDAFPVGRGPGHWREVRHQTFGDDTLRVLEHGPTFTKLIEES